MQFFKKRESLVFLGMFFSAIFSFFGFTSVFADGGVIEISPVVQNINLTPGQAYSGTMTVKNVGTDVLNFSMSVSPYQVTDGDYSPIYTTNNNWTQITDWISVPTNVFSIKPGEYADINYTINTPLDVPAGSQFAVISASSDDGAKNDNTIKVVSSVGMIVSAEVEGETRMSGEILSKNIPGFLLQPPIRANFSLSNTGNVNATANCAIRVTNFFNGSEVYSNLNDPKKIVVMPDTTRNGEVSWGESPFLGIFRVAASLEYLNDTINFSKIVILCPLWFIILTIVIITAAIIIIVLKFKKRNARSRKNKLFKF